MEPSFSLRAIFLSWKLEAVSGVYAVDVLTESMSIRPGARALQVSPIDIAPVNGTTWRVLRIRWTSIWTVTLACSDPGLIQAQGFIASGKWLR